MKNKPEIVAIAMLLSFWLNQFSFGQSNDIEFDHYTTNDGLSFGYTHCIFQDSKGFIWVGTQVGLNRFDGLSFKNYLFDSNDSTSISNNVVRSIIEDTLKNMWIATSKGLSVYNRKKDNFSRKTFSRQDTLSNDQSLITSFIDSRGYMWVAAYRAIFRFKVYDNPQIKSSVINAEKYILNEEDVSYTNKSTVYSIVEDQNQVVWVASYSNKLFYFDDEHKAFIAKSIDYPDANKFSNQRKNLIINTDSDFYFTIESQGFMIWDRKKDKFNFYSSNGTEFAPNDNQLFAIAQDHNGLIWIGGRQTGVNIYNKNTGKFKFILSDPMKPYSLSTNTTVSFYEDRFENMWIGTGAGKGLEKYCPDKKKFKRYAKNTSNSKGLNNNVLCFTESKSGDIWIGTDGQGLNKLNRKTGKLDCFKNNPSDPNSISSNSIISLCEDHQGALWMGTFNGGLCKLEDNKFTTYLPDPDNSYSISSRHIWYVFEDSKENLWLGTVDNGIDLFDRKTNRFYSYVSEPNDPYCLANNGLIQIFEDSKQNLYFTTYFGVSAINLNDYDFSKMPPDLKFRRYYHSENKNSLSSDVICCIAEDENGILWFGTQSTGIDKFDPQTGIFTNFSSHNGLPGNTISSILTDKHNNLWLATNKGLAKFIPETGDIYVFDNQDGMENKSLKGWSLKTKDGEMFFGGPDGFNSFYPDSIQYNKNLPPVIITGLRLFNKPVKIGEKFNNRKILENDISETREIVFKHNEDFITFEFVALNYTVSEKNKYAYMMEGFDKEWIQCGTRREANYTSLDPGKYTFRVKACNNDGYWNETGTSIRVIILPPWWGTWWFYMIITGLLIILIFVTFYIRLALYRKKQAELTVLVTQRTAELEHSNKLLTEKKIRLEEQSEEFKTMNDELYKLNSTKDKLFSIIAHDLRNPFAVILGLSQILVEEGEKLPVNELAEIYKHLHNSSENASVLLDNLLEWSLLQRGRILFEPKHINLSEIITDTIALLQSMALQKRLLIRSFIDPSITLHADENMLKAVLRNLISNAIKFTPENGSITVRSVIINLQVEVTVADTGVGISEKTKKKLFDVGTNISTSGTSNEKGTGLGLILCKEFIDRHNGKIWVESIEGKGSEFKFLLPLQ